MHEYKAEIDRVVDGDTVDVSIDLGFDIWYKARVRLAGIGKAELKTWKKRKRAWRPRPDLKNSWMERR